jgi:predicted transposase YdaD
LRRLHLDLLPKGMEGRSLEVNAIQLMGAKQKEVVSPAQQLIERTRAESTDAATQQNILELIQTICVYKFPELTRQEIEKMLNLDALKETRVYQEAKEEGQQSEKRATIERLLALPLGVEQIVQAVALPIEDVARIIEQIQN